MVDKMKLQLESSTLLYSIFSKYMSKFIETFFFDILYVLMKHLLLDVCHWFHSKTATSLERKVFWLRVNVITCSYCMRVVRMLVTLHLI